MGGKKIDTLKVGRGDGGGGGQEVGAGRTQVKRHSTHARPGVHRARTAPAPLPTSSAWSRVRGPSTRPTMHKPLHMTAVPVPCVRVFLVRRTPGAFPSSSSPLGPLALYLFLGSVPSDSPGPISFLPPFPFAVRPGCAFLALDQYWTMQTV